MKKGLHHICDIGYLYTAVALASDVSLANPIDELIAIIRDSVKNDAAKIAPAYAAIINYESEPNISSSTLWIDSALETDRLQKRRLQR